MGKNLIIAFLLGLLVMQYAYAMKVPDIILGKGVDADLREIVEDYVIKILNEGKYVMSVSSSAVASGDDLDAGAILLDDSSTTKYLCVSNGTTNYRVTVTAIP